MSSTRQESVALAKEADTKKDFSPAKSDKAVHRARNEPEKQLGSLRGMIDIIRSDGGTPSVDSIATALSSMHTGERAPALLALQQTHGNRYVQRVVSGIQAKLKVGQPDDKYEQEADRVADEVMRMPEPEVQRQVEQEEEEEEILQTKPLVDPITPLVQRQVEEEEEEEMLQAKSREDATSEVSNALESQINAIKGGGRPLAESERAFFEPRFGADFSQVKVHTGAQAAESARVFNARAYTMGRNIVFGDGQYAPSTISGRYLLAHELVHTIQQGHYDRFAQHTLSAGLYDGVYEHHADVMAGYVMSHQEDQQLQILSLDSAGPMLQRESADDESEESGSVQVGESIPVMWFRVNSTEFRQDDQADSSIHFNTALQEVQQHLAETGNSGHIILHGYASIEGDTAYNQDLSQRRADRVKELLVAAGIPENQITAIGHGPDSSFSDELSWNRRVEVEMTPQIRRINMPEETIEAQVPVYVCGPDVTAEITTALSNVRSTFGGWTTRAVKEGACNSLDSLLTGGFAWDIINLHHNAWIHQNYRPTCATAGATPPCGSSVQVGSECYYAGSANYVVFGVMCKLCFDHYMSTLNPQGVNRFTKSKMLRLINYYKGTGFSGLATPSPNFAESQQWAVAGYDGWPSGGTPPAGDRSNCSPLCPTQYSQGAFRVNWYPHRI